MSLWERFDLPVLKAINELSGVGHDPSTNDLVDHMGVPRLDIERSLRRLYDSDYVAGTDATVQGEYFDLMNIRLLERGLEAVEEWDLTRSTSVPSELAATGVTT